MADTKENSMILNKHILLCIDCKNPDEDLLKHFCGIVFTDIENFKVYICLKLLKKMTMDTDLIFYTFAHLKRRLLNMQIIYNFLMFFFYLKVS